MKLAFAFMKPMFVNGVGLAAWISVLLFVNMVAPILYLNTVEGQFVLAAALAGALTQMAIFASKGFVRLLGIGHVYWVSLVVWLGLRVGDLTPGEPFTLWVMAVIALNSVSLLIDVRDVTRYISGERMPHLRAS